MAVSNVVFKKSLHLKDNRRDRFITQKLIKSALANGTVTGQKDGKCKIYLKEQDLVIIMNRDRTIVVTSYWKNQKSKKSYVDSLLLQILDECKTVNELLECGDLDEEHMKAFEKKVHAAIKPYTFSKLINWIMK